MIDLDGSVESSEGHQADASAPPELSSETPSDPDSQLIPDHDEGELSEPFEERPLTSPGTQGSSGEADRMLQDPENWQTEGPLESDASQEPAGAGTSSGSYRTGDIPDIGEGKSDFEAQAEELDSQSQVSEEVFEDTPSSIAADIPSESQSEHQLEEYDAEEAVEEDSGLDTTSNTIVNVPAGDHYDGSYEPGEEVQPVSGEASVDEIGEYGNSDSSQKGAIRYTIQIGHIDS
ncbi:MAG: hypothetical protein AAF202_06635, partial [Pseudomonadota bacterium]